MLGRLTLLILTAGSILAQAPVPEIRGLVHERGSDNRIAGVEVRLFEFNRNADDASLVRKLILSEFTGVDGTFTLKPGHLGEFWVEASKNGYMDDLGSSIENLTPEIPTRTLRLSLTLPASLTGRVIDMDGNALANFPVSVETVPIGGDVEAITDDQGFFVAKDLSPRSWVIHIQPKRQAREELVEYSAAEFEIIDEEAESAYWPGGVKTRDQVLPVPVASGGSVNVGTIRVRKTPYYRVHVSLAGECAPNERWIYRILGESEEFPPIQEQFGGCRKDFLLTGLTPGAHTLAVWVGRDVKAWGLAPFTITNKNVETTLRLTPSFSVSGQVKATDGHTLVDLGPIQVLLRPEDGLGAVDTTANSDALGAFTLKTVAWPQQLLSVYAQKPGTYVKEIRYSGLPIKGPRVDMIPGARFEILLDTGTATLTLTGKLKNNDNVLAVRDGMEVGPPGGVPPFQFVLTPERRVPGDESFTNANLPPGTYRLVVIGHDYQDRNMSPEEFAQLVSRGEKVTLQANESKSIEIKK